jgi:phage shock protein PspC (stress-responsive transcriptional regulator)
VTVVYVVAGIAAVLVAGYLVVALIVPERLS